MSTILVRHVRDLLNRWMDNGELSPTPSGAEVSESAKTSSRGELERAQRQVDRANAQLGALKRGDLYFFSLEELRSPCASCDGNDLHVCPYPFSTSPRFSRLLTVWCATCGFGWVPRIPFELNHYYEHEYAQANRKDRDIEPSLYFSTANPMLSQAKVQRYFARADRQVSLIRAHVPSLDALLDFGSGPGYALFKSGAAVRHAVEYDTASHKYLDHLGAQRVTLDALEEERYDAVLSSHSLEHVTRAELMHTLGALVRSLKPGGVLYVEVPTGALARFRLDETKHEPHTLFFTPESLVRIVERAGLEVVLRRSFGAARAKTWPNPVYTPVSEDPFLTTSGGALTVIARKSSRKE